MRRFLTTSILMFLAIGCSRSGQEPEATIVVPSSATSAPEYRGDGSVPDQRYVIRMSDGRRDWEVEFPEVANGYQVRIPLKSEGGEPSRHDQMIWESEELTDADKELLRQLRRDNPAVEREGVYVEGLNVNDPEGENELGGLEPGAELDDEGKTVEDPGPMGLQDDESGTSPSRPSYLLGIEEVQRLYKSGNYELAMVRLAKLEKAYPNDVKILSMKGSLWLKLGRRELAREAWEQVLQIDPDNKGVIQALKQLD